MKLAEAVSLAKESESCKGDPFRVFVACGFTPQHLTIYLKAHLHARLGGRRVVVEPGAMAISCSSLQVFVTTCF